MADVDSRGGPSADTLEAPAYGNPDPGLVAETERLILSSYVLGMDHAAGPLDLADSDYTAIPFEEAIKFMKARVPMTKAEWKGLEEQVRFRAFTVAALSTPDAIERIRKNAIAAVEQGMTLSEFWTATAAENAAGLGESPWYWENVYRTNVQTAYNAGRAVEIMKSQPEYLTLVGINDVRQTEICRSLTQPPIVLPASHPFWQDHWPPFHFGCRTTVRSVFKEETDALRAANPEWRITDNDRLAVTAPPATGFGENPIATGSFYRLTPQMIDRAEQYEIIADIKALAKELGLKNYWIKATGKAAAAAGSGTAPAAPSSPASTVPTFKSVKEAERWIVGADLADAVSFQGSDLRVVQEWTSALRSIMTEFPEARKTMQFFGTCQGRNRKLAEIVEARYYQKMIALGIDEGRARSEARLFGKTVTAKWRTTERTIAEFCSYDGIIGIAVNERYAKSYEAFLRTRARDIASGWKPPGTEKIVATLEHEMGHLLDHEYGLSASPELQSYYRSLSKEEIASGLSGYATSGVKDFVAEAWSEYRTSAAPREIAREVAGILRAIMEKRR